MNTSADSAVANGNRPDQSDATEPASEAEYTPYVPPPSETPAKQIVNLNLRAPFRWLLLGWQDLLAAKGISIFYGGCFSLMALMLGTVFRNKPEYAMSVASGCLLLGPFLAVGLYEVSKRRELGQVPDWIDSLTCWRSHLRSMGMLVLVLIVRNYSGLSGLMKPI